MKLIYGIIFIIVGSAAYAESASLNLALPNAPGSYQSDSFDAGELRCSNAIGSASTLEYGVTGILTPGTDAMGIPNGTRQGDIGVYARITIPIGKRVKNRVDCNRLYELELRKKQLEVMKLEEEVRQLRDLQTSTSEDQFEN